MVNTEPEPTSLSAVRSPPMPRVRETVPLRSLTTVSDEVARLSLMEERTLAPLLQWEASGFTERHWSELTDDELRRFVKAGDERENILARRDDDATRVRAALRDRRPPPPPKKAQSSGTSSSSNRVLVGPRSTSAGHIPDAPPEQPTRMRGKRAKPTTASTERLAAGKPQGDPRRTK